MRLDTIVKIAEIVSAIAVIITLIILIYEVRENTESNRALVYGQEIDRLNKLRFIELNNPELTQIHVRYQQGELSGLTEAQQLTLRRILGAQWSVYESAYFQFLVGNLGQREWSRYDRNICRQYQHAVDADIWESLILSMTVEFSQFVTSTCDA